MPKISLAKQPVFKVVAGVLIAVLGAIFSIMVFTGDLRSYLLVYDVPILIPFAMFMLDRLASFNETTLTGKGIDFITLAAAITRAFINVPIISGHTLFLVYAIVTSSSKLTRATCVLVLIEVAYIKIFIWRDPTLIGGTVVGIIMGLAFRQLGRKENAPAR
jgi:hypothetical protein